MPEIELTRLRRLRSDAESLLRSLAQDLDSFRHKEPHHGFRRTPSSESIENDVGITTTCSCLMALALSGKLDEVFGDEMGLTEGAAIFDKILDSPWMSSGLPENNAFTTTLVLRLLGFLVECGSFKKEAPQEKTKFWEPRIEFEEQRFRAFLTELHDGTQPFSKYLFTLFPKDLQRRIESFLNRGDEQSKKLEDKIRIELERLIGAGSFYQESLFTGIELSTDTQQLLSRDDKYAYQVARINRRLLHDSFSHEITPLISRSLRAIAEIMASDQDRFKINEYPPAAAVVYWFVDGISRAGIPLQNQHWQNLYTFAAEEFGRQRSLVVARHMAMMDPVAMAMSACLCARLRRISKEQPSLGALHDHANILPSAVELESAAVALFAEMTDAGIWPKYFPLFHYQDAGSNFCFSFELLEAVLKEFGYKQDRLVAGEGVIAGLERAITWCKENRLVYSAKRPSIGSTEKAAKDSTGAYEGWNSGGNLDTLRKGMPESWATAVVHMFLWELIEVLSDHIQRRLLDAYGARRPTEKWKTLENLLDIELLLDKKHESLIQTLATTIVATFASYKGNNADRLRRTGVSKKPLSALLFGPPGTSKTEVAKALSKELDWPLVEIDPSKFLEKGFQNIYAKGDEIFDDVDDMCGVVVLFDEMDALVQKRDAEESLAVESRFLTTYMLPKLAKLHDRGRLVFLMATNFQEKFDDAIKRAGRFDMLLCMGPPTLQAKCNSLHTFYGMDEGSTDTRAAGDKIMRFASQKGPRALWLADQLSLLTFGEFEAFIASLGKPKDIRGLDFDHFYAKVKEKSDSVLLRRDDLNGIKVGTKKSWKTISDLDTIHFRRDSLAQTVRFPPIVKYLLDRKQSRRQYPLRPSL